MRILFAFCKFLGFVFACLICVPPQILIMFFTKGSASRVLPVLWMKLICFIFQIRVRVEGEPYKGGHVILMCNHLSYLDIIAIGSVIPHSFVSREDVANWPLIGFLAGLRQTAYVVRGSSDPVLASKGVESRLKAGDSLVIFPEGTSTDGRNVRDFKTGVFARAIDAKVSELMIQPATLFVKKSDGRAVKTQDDRDLYAWHIDMDEDFGLFDHLWRFAQTSGSYLNLCFHEPIAVQDYNDRKILAKDTHKAVSNGLVDLLQMHKQQER